MRTIAAVLGLIALVPSLGLGAVAPLDGRLGEGVDGLPPPLPVVDIPLLVDEDGDTMTGDLGFGLDLGLAFLGGRLTGDSVLAFGGKAVCLEEGAGPGCGDVTSVLAGEGLEGGGDAGALTLAVNFAAAQRRVAAACPPESSIRSILADGTVVCETDSDSGGDVTSVSVLPGSGLTGGAAGGDATLGTDPAVLQRRVAQSCAVGSAIRSIASDGTVLCEADDGVGVVQVNTGSGLTGGPINASGTISVATNGITSLHIATGAVGSSDVDSAQVQLRVASSCPTGHGIRTVNLNGTVLCQPDTVLPAWRKVPRTNSLATVETEGRNVSLAIGSDGLPVLAASGASGLGGFLRVVKCSVLDCSQRTTALNGFSAGEASITIGADGFPVIAHRISGPGSGNFNLAVSKCVNLGCTQGTVRTTVDNTSVGGLSPHSPSLGIGTDGLPVLAYAGAGVRVAKCGNAACSAGNTVTMVASGWTPSLAVSTDGLPLVAYAHELPNGSRVLKVLHCGDAACTAGNTATTVEPAANPFNIGFDPSLGLGADGLPIVAYVIGTDLAVVKCGNADCTAGNVKSTVDASVDVASPSLVVGADGLPSIAYTDRTNGDLRYARCRDVACASAAIATIDTAGSVGSYPSLAEGTDGLPVIAHMDATDPSALAVRFAQLANEFGVNYLWRRG